MATPKGDHNPTQYESPWLFCEGVLLMRNSDQETCNSTLNTQRFFLTHALLWPVPGVQFAGMVQKDASRKKSEGGGVWSESVGSLSPSSPPPLIFSRFVTLHRTSPTAQNRLALLPQAISL